MPLLLATEDITVVLELGKIAAYFAVAASVFKVAQVLLKYYDAWQVHMAEHRMVVEDLWERRPELRETFDQMILAKSPAVFKRNGKYKSKGAGL